MIPPRPGGAGYSTFVIVGTVGLLIPLTCTFAGIGVIVDRTSGARRELLAAPIPRSLIVLGNMAVAITISLPDWLAWAARILSTTHTLALLRYGVLDPSGAGLHDIWHMTNTTAEAALSLLVLAGWAALATAVSIQVFRRSAVT